MASRRPASRAREWIENSVKWAPGPALRLLTDVADFHFSDIAVTSPRTIGGAKESGGTGSVVRMAA
jgi:hypothetical protein